MESFDSNNDFIYGIYSKGKMIQKINMFI
jgi:hypothetical protein